jgi:hypothetical protein
MILLLLAIILTCWRCNRILIRNKRYMNLLLYKIFLYGANMDVSYKDGETLREYFARLNYQTGINFEDLIEIYEENLYGEHVIKDNNYKVIINKLNRVKNKVILRRGKLSFLIIDLVITLKVIGKSIKK